MKKGDKIVCVDGRHAGETWHIIEFEANKAFVKLKSEKTGNVVELPEKQIYGMVEIGEIKIWRNGYERAKTRARKRISI